MKKETDMEVKIFDNIIVVMYREKEKYYCKKKNGTSPRTQERRRLIHIVYVFHSMTCKETDKLS